MEKIEVKVNEWKGAHTLEVGFLDCGLDNEFINHKKAIRSHSIIMVAENDLLFVFLDKPEKIDILRSFNRGEKYRIRFSNISDIMKSNDNEHLKLGNGVLPSSVVIQLNSGSTCKISYNSTQLGQQILHSFQSFTILKSACLPKLDILANTEIVDEYLKETLNGLKLDTCMIKNQSKENNGMEETYNEFSSECIVDLNLKEAACRSRELFVSSILLCQELIYAPPPRSTLNRSSSFISATGMRNSQSTMSIKNTPKAINSSSSGNLLDVTRNLFVDKIRKEESISEVQIRLQSVALSRLVLIRGALKVVYNLVFLF